MGNVENVELLSPPGCSFSPYAYLFARGGMTALHAVPITLTAGLSGVSPVVVHGAAIACDAGARRLLVDEYGAANFVLSCRTRTSLR